MNSSQGLSQNGQSTENGNQKQSCHSSNYYSTSDAEIKAEEE